MDKKGDVVLADLFSIIFTVILLGGFIVYALAFGSLNGVKYSMELDQDLSSLENIYVLEAYLESSYNGQNIGDLILLWKEDGNYKDELIDGTKNVFDSVYGKCYMLSINNELFIGESKFDGSKASCLEYLNGVEVCLDNSMFDEKFSKGEEEECY